jgi:hypothetical protein
LFCLPSDKWEGGTKGHTNMQEEWKPCIGFEGIYEISTLGKVKSLIRKGSKIEKIRKLQLRPDGYFSVGLRKKSKTKNYFVHRLVAMAFIKNEDNKKIINHLDGVKNNNYYENLEWSTYSENTNHAYKLFLMQRGEKHFKAKLSIDDVLEIRNIYPNGSISLRKLAKRYNVSCGAIQNILKYKTWKHIALYTH